MDAEAQNQWQMLCSRTRQFLCLCDKRLQRVEVWCRCKRCTSWTSGVVSTDITGCIFKLLEGEVVRSVDIYVSIGETDSLGVRANEVSFALMLIIFES
jgi:hypothetical protein